MKKKIQQVMLVRKLFVQRGKSATLVEAQFNGKISRQSNVLYSHSNSCAISTRAEFPLNRASIVLMFFQTMSSYLKICR